MGSFTFSEEWMVVGVGRRREEWEEWEEWTKWEMGLVCKMRKDCFKIKKLN